MSIMNEYVTKQNPYDAEALNDLISIFPMRKFGPEMELNQKVWEKKIRWLKAKSEVWEKFGL